MPPLACTQCAVLTGSGVMGFPLQDSYTTFAPLFDRVIEDYHNGYKCGDPVASHIHSPCHTVPHGSGPGLA